MTLTELVQEKRVLVCVGSGGVGKTTTSAAIALRAAAMGRKVCVLTIDPAKRLANAMGLEKLGNKETRISDERLKSAGLGKSAVRGELWAMMLDTKRTWDDLVEKFAASKEQKEKILANRYYQQISGALAGSQEFMAMEKLYELHESGKYDLLVLDTPPTRNALDFLDAPKKMMGMMDDDVIKLFVNPGLRAGKLGLGLLKTSGAWMFKILERVTGFQVLADLSEYIGSFSGMYSGFRERAQRVEELLRDDVSAFLLVTSPAPSTVEEAIYFFEKIEEAKIPFGGFVVNRVHHDALDVTGAKTEWKRMRKEPALFLKALGASGRGKGAEALAERLSENFQAFQALAEMDAEQMERLRTETAGKGRGKDKRLWRTVPHFELDVHDLSGLARVGDHLFEGS